jgi:Zn-dependent protease with chaperone function
MDFFASQEQAQRKTTLLVCYFVLAICCIVAMNYVLLGFALGMLGEHSDSQFPYWNAELFLAVTAGTLCVIGLGSLFKTSSLSGGGSSVAEMFNGRRIDPASTDPNERRLLNVVEEMAIASGTPVPPVYLLDTERGINAFAAGFTPSDAVITVTRGSLQTLSRDELQGVIAHEFSHILRGDMRLNIRLMGVLYGILVISMIGWFLFRLTAGTRTYNLSDDREKKGGNPLPLIGLALYVIGYVGVFFGKLIKSAVSRQREFLADASAVQFTRNPGGIAGALKKIGGVQQGSKIEHPAAEEASHMFFGRGLSESLFGWMDTHPPLHERIKRIDPSFDGVYPPVMIEPGSDQRDGEQGDGEQQDNGLSEFNQAAGFAPSPQSVRVAAEAPVLAELVDRTEFNSGQVAAHVGAPQTVHLQHAAAVLDALPPELISMAREPNTARAVILALLLDPDPAIREQQLSALSQMEDATVLSAVNKILPITQALHPACRLPLAQLTLPALRNLSLAQHQQFAQVVQQLAAADQKISLFEYALQRMLMRHLGANFTGRLPEGVKFYDQAAIQEPVANLLGVLAHAGGNVAAAEQAFGQGVRTCFGPGASIAIPPREAMNLRALDMALSKIALASPAIKQRVLAGCTACIAADGRMTVAEGELLRVIADALDCPMPPLTLPAGTA